jgi:hypothetical protein
VARALIVGCGCRGRTLGAALGDAGWAVRGTSRAEARLAPISAAGLEPAVADPEQPGSILEAIDGVAVIHWLLGSAGGGEEVVAAIHGPRLESLLAKLVDTPVRGFVYEAAGSIGGGILEQGTRIVMAAGERWQIPFEIVTANPDDHSAWLEAMLGATTAALGPGA